MLVRMIKLQDTDGLDVWVNPIHVVSVRVHAGVTVVKTRGDNSTISVRETLKEVVKLIEEGIER